MGQTSVTPGRHTKLVIDPGGLPSVLRPGQTIRRPAATMVPARTPLSSSYNVQLVPEAGWVLAATPTERSGTIRVTESAQVIQPAQVTTPTNLGVVNMNPSNAITALPGMLSGGAPPWTAGSVLSFVKQVPAGQNWDGAANDLTASRAALPKPVLPTEDLPMDRVLHGRVTYGKNGAFGIGFMIPAGYYGPDNLLNFYFGGETTATNAATGNAITAGRYCLNLRGSSTAVLYEWDGGHWQIRYVFPWTTHVSRHAGTFHVIRVRPVGSTDIQFETHEGDTIGAQPGGFTLLGLLTTIAGTGITSKQLQDVRTFTYRHAPNLTGIKKPDTVTGPGPVMVDVRRDLRIPFHIVQHLYAPTGALIDLPFSIDFPVLPMTAMVLTADTYLPSGTSLLGSIIDPVTGAGVAPGGTDPVTGGPRFLTTAGKTVYAVRIDFGSDSNRVQTPVLRGYEVKVDGVTVVRATTPVIGGHEASGALIRQVSITGPDTAADHDTASLLINDAAAVFSNRLSTGILENRGRVPAKIGVYDDSGNLISWLFQGEVARCTATRKGRKQTQTWTASLQRPESEWRQLDISFTGMWARLAEHVNFSTLQYYDDPAYFKLTGKKIGWKITDVIRDILSNQLGFPSIPGADYLDIPDLPLRLWTADWAAPKEEWMIQAGVSLADLLQKLARDYLGLILLWDPNAGANGMWRLVQSPLLGSAYGNPPLPTPVARFFGYPDKSAGGAPQLTLHPNSYNTGSTFIQRGSLHTFVQAPECNYVLVLGKGGQIPSVALKDPAFKCWAAIVNPASDDFPGFPPPDPTSPDYLGRFVPVVHVDPLLITPEACAWVARRIYDQAAHARSWVKFRAPLLLITDPNDPKQTRPRPLRIGDVVTVTTGNAQRTCVVRSANPDYRNDNLQAMEMECLIVN